MTRWPIPAAAAVACVALAAVADPSAVAAMLLDAPGRRLELLERGVTLMRVLLLCDAGVLALLAWRGLRPEAPVGVRPEAPVDADSGTPGTRRERDARAIWGLAGLLAMAGVVRLVGLGGDLWMDEVFTLVNYVRPGLGTIVADFTDDNQHALYSLAAWSSIGLLGEHPAALRLPALLFGLASIWATLRLGRHHLGEREAWLAALLLTFSYHHVWFSQNARGYTILLAATVLATDLWLRGFRSSSRRTWTLYAIVVALGMWAHLTMIFVALAHAAMAVTGAVRSSGAGRLAPLAALLAAGWLTVHVYALTLPQMLEFFMQPGAGSTTGVTWNDPIWLFNETVRSLGIGLGLGWFGVACGAAFGAYGLLLVWRRQPRLAVAMVLPSVVGGVTILALGRSLWPRFFFSAAGFVALVAMCGAVGLGDRARRAWWPRRPAAALAPALLLIVASATTLPRVYRHPKQAYTAAREFVRANMIQGDRVAPLHVAGRVYEQYYAPGWREVTSAAELRRIEAQAGRTWVLYTLPSYLAEAEPELVGVLEASFEVVAVFPGTLGDGEIVVSRSR